MSLTVNYETIDRSVGSGRNYSGGIRNLGKSDPARLALAFISPINDVTYTAADAATAFQSYGGTGNENVSYGLGMYRRDFKPVGGGLLYDSPRDKDTTPIGAAGLPATPYSPNIASPGEGYGVQATSIAASVVGLIPANARLPENLNPSIDGYQNLATGTAPTGAVRKFNLGIGSRTVRDNSNP